MKTIFILKGNPKATISLALDQKVQAQKLAQNINYIIGMESDVLDEAAITKQVLLC